MLSYKILNRKIEERNEKLIPNELLYNNGTSEYEMTFDTYHHLNTYDNITFTYGNDEYYKTSLSKETSKVNEKKVSFGKFDDYRIYPSNVYTIENFSYNGGEVKALCFEFNNVMHDFFDIRDNIKINEVIDSINDGIGDKIRCCPNDYVVCNNIFLLQVSGVSKEGRYIVDDECIKNYKHKIYFYKDNEEVKSEIECIIPVFNDGKDNRRVLYWKYDETNETDKENVEYIIDNFYNINFYTNDDRFIREDNTLRDKVKIEKICNTIDINLPIGEMFENNMNQKELIVDNFITKVVDENINDIVDMEKQIFNPAIVSNNTVVCDNVNKINFTFNFLERDDWGKNTPSNDRYENTPCLLGDLGFTDDDVFYQKNCIKKSFVRLSFYDSPYRNKQSLLFYSTIFLDSGELYGKYTRNINRGFEKTEDCNMVLNSNGKCKNKDVIPNFEPLECKLSISNAFDRTKSSEGYYLYLYPSLCKNGETTIYMKVEFNHAKFGYTIPLSAPTNEAYKKGGYIGSSNDYSSDMNKLLNDLYIPVKIRHNKDKNRYEWYVEDRVITDANGNVNEYIKNSSYEITFNLYEPIVNKIN